MVEETSLEAYFNIVEPLLSEKQVEVLRVFKMHTDRSFTNMELADMLGWSINRVTPRTNELRKIGALKTVGKRFCRITGNTAFALELRINDPR